MYRTELVEHIGIAYLKMKNPRFNFYEKTYALENLMLGDPKIWSTSFIEVTSSIYKGLKQLRIFDRSHNLDFRHTSEKKMAYFGKWMDILVSCFSAILYESP